MSELSRPPERLSATPQSPLERALLRVGTDVVASEATRAGVFEALGIERHIAVTSRPKVWVFRRTSLLLAAMVVSAVALAIPVVRLARSGSGADSGVAAPAIEAVTATEHRAGDPGPAIESSSSAGVPETPTGTVSLPKAVHTTDEPGSARSTSGLSGRNALAAELAALDSVRAKLNAGEPKAAQALLDNYQHEFPKARLALEAEVLRIDALDRAGQTDAARKRAAAFVQNHPKGVLTGRVRRYLEK